jgi:hypothetical protein
MLFLLCPATKKWQKLPWQKKTKKTANAYRVAGFT